MTGKDSCMSKKELFESAPIPSVLSATIAHLLRNVGHAKQANAGVEQRRRA